MSNLIERNTKTDAILSYIDGPSKKGGKVFIVTTNEENSIKDLLPEITRPGRLDTIVKLKLPTKDLRKQYIDTWKIPLSDEIKQKILNSSDKFSFARLNKLQAELAIMYLGDKIDLKRALNIVNKKISDGVEENKGTGNRMSDLIRGKMGFAASLKSDIDDDDDDDCDDEGGSLEDE